MPFIPSAPGGVNKRLLKPVGQRQLHAASLITLDAQAFYPACACVFVARLRLVCSWLSKYCRSLNTSLYTLLTAISVSWKWCGLNYLAPTPACSQLVHWGAAFYMPRLSTFSCWVDTFTLNWKEEKKGFLPS